MWQKYIIKEAHKDKSRDIAFIFLVLVIESKKGFSGWTKTWIKKEYDIIFI